MSVAVYPSTWPTWSPSPEGYGNMSSMYCFGLSEFSSALNAWVSSQIFCHLASIFLWSYFSAIAETIPHLLFERSRVELRVDSAGEAGAADAMLPVFVYLFASHIHRSGARESAILRGAALFGKGRAQLKGQCSGSFVLIRGAALRVFGRYPAGNRVAERVE